jgi:hypothetical protein
MPKGRRTRVWNALAVVTVLGAVASLADRASFGGLIIIGPSKCLTNATAAARNRTALRRARAVVPHQRHSGAASNPRFGGANCSPTIGVLRGVPSILNMTNLPRQRCRPSRPD